MTMPFSRRVDPRLLHHHPAPACDTCTVSVDWGNLPAYFGGLAFLATVGIIGRDHRERIREQANHLAAWVDADGEKQEVVVRNASDLPVFRIAVYLRGPAKSPRISLSKYAADSATGYLKPQRRGSIGPGATVTLKAYEIGPVRVIGLDFTDAAGVQWERRGSKLRKASGLSWVRFRRWFRGRIVLPIQRRRHKRQLARSGEAS